MVSGLVYFVLYRFVPCIFTGRAQGRVYSALSTSDCENYAEVKTAVLKVYELLSEVHQEKFRTLSKWSKAHVEFARELTTAFNRWCMVAEVSTFEEMSNLMVLEKFKNTIPSRAATYITEQKAGNPAEAVELADNYV